MAATPKNNLPPESQPWARYVEEQVRDLKTETTVTKSAAQGASKMGASSAALAALHEVAIQEATERANQQDVVIESVGATANGKNTITRSEDPAPVGATPGADGDLWQQFSGTQIVAQWTHNGTEYVSSTLSHEVISSIDLGTATVGALTGAVIQTAASGARIELTADHFRKYDASENIEVDMPVGGAATFSGVISGSDIIGGTIKTSLTGNRVEISPDANPSGGGGLISLFTGHVAEREAANIWSFGFTTNTGDNAQPVGTALFVGANMTDNEAAPYLYFETRGASVNNPNEYTLAWLGANDIIIGDNENASTLFLNGQAIVYNLGLVDKTESGNQSWVMRRIFVVDSSLTYTNNSLDRLVLEQVPSIESPLFIWDVSLPLGENLKSTIDGITWKTYAGAPPSASDTQEGVVELATVAESIVGTDSARAVPPAGLKARMDAINLSGTYAARPAATAVPVGSMYYCTDIPETYRSNGTAWSVVGSGGSELGYAEILTTVSTTSTTGVDVAGLSITTVVGERPIKVIFDGPLRNTTAGAYARVLLVVDGTSRANGGGPSTGFHGRHREVRVSGLTPGTEHTFKIQLVAPTGGTASIAGDPVDPAFIQVVTV